MSDLIYRPLPVYTIEEAREILKNGNLQELRLLPMSLGMYLPLWNGSQRICLDLTKHENEIIRVNAARGLGYIVIFDGEIDKRLAKPALLEVLRSCSEEQRGFVLDTIEDINYRLGWKLANDEL